MLILMLIDVHNSQKAVFSFEKGPDHEHPSSSGSHHLVKKSNPAIFRFLTPPPPPLNAVWKTLVKEVGMSHTFNLV